MLATSDQPVIIFHYQGSPYAKRVLWYLALQGIPYAQCMQPNVLPRPDLLQLGINYRRIPVLAIGGDVYLDSRLILQKLEQLAMPKSRLAADNNPEHCIIERLFEVLCVDGGLFTHVTQILMAVSPMLRNPKLLKDRLDFVGSAKSLNRDTLAAARPQAINEVRNVVDLIEKTLLADGREWILNTKRPSLADIEMAWPLFWLFSAPGALPEEQISAKLFPKVFAWVERLDDAAVTAERSMPTPETLSGEQAAGLISQSVFQKVENRVEENDEVVRSQGLKAGDVVEVWPTDTGSAHRTVGKLVSLSNKEVIIKTVGKTSVRVHAARHGFQITLQTPTGSHL